MIIFVVCAILVSDLPVFNSTAIFLVVPFRSPVSFVRARMMLVICCCCWVHNGHFTKIVELGEGRSGVNTDRWFFPIRLTSYKKIETKCGWKMDFSPRYVLNSCVTATADVVGVFLFFLFCVPSLYHLLFAFHFICKATARERGEK